MVKPVHQILKIGKSLLVYSIFLHCFSAFAAPQTSKALGENLLGEVCESRDLLDRVAPEGLTQDSQLFCGGREAGSFSYLPLEQSPSTGKDSLKQDLQQGLVNSAVQKSIDAKMQCKLPTKLSNKARQDVLIFPCQLRSGGWQHIVVVSQAGKVLQIAEGSPSVSNVLFRMAGLSDEQAFKESSKSKLSELWKEPVVLASPADLDVFKRLMREGTQANSTTNYLQAEDSFRKALELQGRFLAEDDVAIANTLMDLAISVSNQGKYDQAQALFLRAEPIIQKSPDEADRARFAYYKGIDSANRGQYLDAAAYGAQSVVLWRKIDAEGSSSSLLSNVESAVSPEKSELALALNFNAAMALRNEDYATANVLASEALLLISRIDSAPAFWKADVMVTLGEVSITQGRLSAAETYFKSAYAIRKQRDGEGPSTWAIQTALGKAYQREGMNTSAIITYRKVFQSAKMHQGETALFAKEQLIPFEAALVDYSKQLTDEQQKQGLFAEGFDAFQMTRAGVVNQTIQKAQARLTTADPAISALIDRVQLAQRNVESARVALSLEQALPDIERSAEVERNLENRLQANQKEFDTTNQQLSMQFPAYSKLTNPQPLALLDVRNSLGDHEAIVSFMLGRKQSFVQLTKRSGNYITKMDVSEADLFDVVKSLRNALEVRAGSIHEFDLQKSNALFETIFGGLREPLQDVTHLLVAPSGPLASLPFGLLVTEPAKSEDYSQAKWLIQKMAISQVPSIQAFYTLRTSAHHTKPAKSLLAFADPVLEGPTQHTIEFQCKTAGPMNSAVLRALAPLPDTASEVQTVANVLGRDKSTLMFKEQATEQSFRAQKLSDYRVIYFATHGLLPGELRCQSEPGLVLTPPKQQATQTSADGLLAASEIAGMKLNADMVVLSACNTAGSGGKFGGDALSGLAESFFFAGARSLVASHWQVPSSATASLLSNMFIQLGPQLQGGAAPALRAAQMQMLSQKPQSHPFFWAAFVVLGDGMATGSTQ